MAARAVLGLAALALVAGACVSPTLPLPPPDAPYQISAAPQSGYWQLRGECTPGATVLVKNDATTVIAGVEDSDRDGRYFITVQAKACDMAEVWEILGTTATTAATFVIEPTVNGTPAGGCK